MTFQLRTGPLKTCFKFNPVLKCEPSTYQPTANDLTTAPLKPVVGERDVSERDVLVECNHLAQTRNYIFGRCGVVQSFQFHPELV